ncbi:MAG TPA: saccharopine dehydrogenase NADP-binding domain-containing protein [Rudaea sp.]|jgi:short subunit dehydrogenase-like uncharacterized protein
MPKLMIYGANGYTGRLIAREAARRGLKPMLAGRNRDEIAALADELGLLRRVFELSGAKEIERNLDDIDLVLHCAGPFSSTAAPMLDACLNRKVHYLDITGEIDVFALCHRADQRARDAGIVVLPGSGFDVVPTDCLAAMLKQRLPDATSLVLAFEAGGGPSPGTAKTSVEGMAKGGRVRIDGELTDVPLAWKSREFVRDGKTRSAMTIPWGDVYTSYVSTGIPNVETYMVVPPKTIQRMRWMRRLQPLLGLGFVQDLMKRRIERATPGPSALRRQDSGCHVWGEVTNAAGKQATLALKAPNGYDLTVTASLGIVQHLFAQRNVAGGYFTPSRLMGADYVLSLPGVKLVDKP